MFILDRGTDEHRFLTEESIVLQCRAICRRPGAVHAAEL